MEKYITFLLPIKKECDDGKTITYKLRFMDSFRFMSTSLSELLITCMENLIIKNANHAQEIIDAKNAKT